MKETVDLDLLRRLIREKRWKTEALAKEVGISRASLSAVLNGHRQPGYVIMKEMYRTLQLTPEQANAVFFSPASCI